MIIIFTQILTGFNFRVAQYVFSVLLTSKGQHTTQSPPLTWQPQPNTTNFSLYHIWYDPQINNAAHGEQHGSVFLVCASHLDDEILDSRPTILKFSVASPVPLGKCHNSASNQAMTACFGTLFHSLVINHPFIHCYVTTR